MGVNDLLSRDGTGLGKCVWCQGHYNDYDLISTVEGKLCPECFADAQAAGMNDKGVWNVVGDPAFEDALIDAYIKEKAAEDDDDAEYNKWWENNKAGKKPIVTGTVGGYNWNKCTHYGNVEIFRRGEGALYAGGVTRGARADGGMVVIDLTGGDMIHEHSTGTSMPQVFASIQRLSVDYVSLPITDFAVPRSKFTNRFWRRFATEIDGVLQSGRDVLVCCQGGHGRTGMVVSILAALIVGIKEPIEWLRSVYCQEAVETENQERYVTAVITDTEYVPAVAAKNTYMGYRLGDDLR